jgi:hypothetical protein
MNMKRRATTNTMNELLIPLAKLGVTPSCNSSTVFKFKITWLKESLEAVD